MQAGNRLAGLVSDALSFVAPSLRIRVHGALLPPFEDWLAVRQPERSFS
jgi:hypothetical protein